MPRVIYSLMFTFKSPPPSIVQLVVPLNREGQSENGLPKPVPPKRRIIDLRVGDWLRFRDKVRKITQVEALHDAHIREGQVRTNVFGEGYEVRAS